MFHKAEEIDEKHYPLRLYVEVENKRAQQVYQRLGMFDTNEIFIEDDFHFDDRLKFEDTKEYKFSIANKEDMILFKEQLKTNNLKSLMDKNILNLESTLKCIDQLISGEHRGNIIVVNRVNSQKNDIKEE